MKMPKGQGYYVFEDGYMMWVYGLSATEKRNEIRKHGKIISYKPGM